MLEACPSNAEMADLSDKALAKAGYILDGFHHSHGYFFY